MSTLIDDIYKSSDWIVKAFAELGKKLDYSINSLKEIDNFFNEQIENGKPKPGSVLENNFGGKIFAISAYVGETLLKNCHGSLWIVNDQDPQGEINISIKLPNGTIVWPAQKVIKRIKNGSEDNIYIYGHILIQKVRLIF